jgi:hypothetical protein
MDTSVGDGGRAFPTVPVALVPESPIFNCGITAASMKRQLPESFRYRPKNASTSRALSSLASGFPPIVAPLPCRASGTRMIGAYESKL